MRNVFIMLAATVVGIAGICREAAAQHTYPIPECEPGYTLISETGYKDVIKKICRPVTEVKKKVKWVYGCRPEDFCLPRCGCPLHALTGHAGCETCASCSACAVPASKNLLIKKKVVEEILTTKWVVETVVEQVPCVIYRKVPCNTLPTSPHAPFPGSVPPPVRESQRPYHVGASFPAVGQQGILPAGNANLGLPQPGLPE
jgi:hypothetical protein